MSSRTRAWLAIFGIGVFSASYLYAAFDALDRTLEEPRREARMRSRDASHYLAMAKAFSEGRFFDAYVSVWPHRQPLYPALLALMMRARGDDTRDLATVNILVVLATLWALYFLASWLFGSPATGMAAALAYATSRFVIRNAQTSLLTEPVFLLCALLGVGLALAYLAGRQGRLLWLASVALGMAYLARPNGLFLMVGLCAGVVVRTLQTWWSRRKTAPAQAVPELRAGAWALAVAVGIFVGVTTPSWIPRLVYWKNPIYHGYLPNYLWVDTYPEGHLPGPPRYGPRHYFESHDLRDVALRVRRGLVRVFYRWPLDYGRWHLTLAALGATAAVVARRPWCLGVLIMLAVQSLPLVWTAVSNPTPRVAYGALLPFIVLFVAVLADELRGSEARPVDATARDPSLPPARQRRP